jgi:hypothetical protein
VQRDIKNKKLNYLYEQINHDSIAFLGHPVKNRLTGVVVLYMQLYSLFTYLPAWE